MQIQCVSRWKTFKSDSVQFNFPVNAILVKCFMGIMTPQVSGLVLAAALIDKYSKLVHSIWLCAGCWLTGWYIYRISGNTGGELNFAVWRSRLESPTKVPPLQVRFGPPPNLNSANTFGCPVWSQIAKFNVHQYYHLYGRGFIAHTQNLIYNDQGSDHQ